MSEPTNKKEKIPLRTMLYQQLLFGSVGLVWMVNLDLILETSVAGVLRDIVIAAVLAAVLVLLALLTERVFPKFMASLYGEVVELWQMIGIKLTPAVIVVLSLAAGVGEELLFRGALQGWTATVISPWLAVGLVSIAFGLLHATSAKYIVVTAVLGFILGGVYLVTGSLVVVIVAHFLYDIWALDHLSGLLDQQDESRQAGVDGKTLDSN